MESPQDWKPAKKRVKALYGRIKEQVEFYFGDSNLDKDRFFKKQIDKSKDGSIPLQMLLSFNRVKTLTDDLSILEKALSSSTKLKLSDDRRTVRRVTPYSKPKDVDKRTVYVEKLPSHVDHDWIKRIFSRCGVVSYISIPRYKSTGDPKSFAFVEFETIEGAKKACQVLNNPPEETEMKPGKFPKHNKTMVQLKKKMTTSLDVSEVKEADLSGGEKGKTRQKRKRKMSNCSADGRDSSDGKRRRSDPLCGESSEEGCSKVLVENQNESVIEGVKSEDEDKICGKKRKKRKQRQYSESSGNKSQDEEGSDKSRQRSDSFSRLHDSDGGSKAKFRRRAYSCSKLTDSELVGKVTKKDPESKPEVGEQAESEKEEEEKESAKVDDPSEAKSVEEKPKTDCSAEAATDLLCKEGKRKRKKEMDSVESDVENLPKHPKLPKLSDVLEGEVVDFKKRRHQQRKPKKPYPHLRVISKEEWLQYKTEYLNTQRSNMALLKKMLVEKSKQQEPSVVAQNPARENYEFIPNVIINVKSDLLLNVKELKEKLNPIAKIAYIDLKEVDLQAFIRCRDEESARTICDSKFPHYKFYLLQGEDEKSYWEKLKADREAKINNKQRVKKRGTSKLMDKIEKLNTQNSKVYFDE